MLILLKFKGPSKGIHFFSVLSISPYYTSQPSMCGFQSVPQMKTVFQNFICFVYLTFFQIFRLFDFIWLTFVMGLCCLLLLLNQILRASYLLVCNPLLLFLKALLSSLKITEILLSLKSLFTPCPPNLNHSHYHIYVNIFDITHCQIPLKCLLFSNSVYLFLLSANSLHYSLIHQ